MSAVFIVSNVLGAIGTFLWCIQLVPQLWRNYRNKDCTGVPLMMMFFWFMLGVPFCIYFSVVKCPMGVRIQPPIFMFCLAITCYQVMYYPPVNLGFWKASGVILAVIVVGSGTMTGAIIPMLREYDSRGKDNHWGAIIGVGVLATVMLIGGLVPPYLDLFKNRGRVVGVNFLFLAIDCIGAICSATSVGLLSMDPPYHIDIMGIVMYGSVMAMELGLFACQGVWLLRFRTLGTDSDSSKSDAESQTPVEAGSSATAIRLYSLPASRHPSAFRHAPPAQHGPAPQSVSASSSATPSVAAPRYSDVA